MLSKDKYITEAIFKEGYLHQQHYQEALNTKADITITIPTWCGKSPKFSET